MKWTDILKRRATKDAIFDAKRNIDMDEEEYFFGSEKVAAQDYRDEIKLLMEFKEKQTEKKKDWFGEKTLEDYSDLDQYYKDAMKRLKKGSSLITINGRKAFENMKLYMKEKMEYEKKAPPQFLVTGSKYFNKKQFTGQNMPEELAGENDTVNIKSKR